MAGELSDCNGDGNSLSVPEDAQSTYIRKLEERLISLEQKVHNIESTNQEHSHYLEGNERSHNDDKAVQEGKGSNQQSHPPFPPTVLEARMANQYPSQSSFAPPQAQAGYNLAAAGPPPVTSLYAQQPQQPHYVLQGPSMQNTYGQLPMATGYHQPQALTPVPQVQRHERGSDSESDM
ncbi:hypothetical protein BDV39DRAFT_206089 [Aspergillus sergii]|uniref:Uncharacterized protein n=1 Tax=Aspergillus sergii TaxID=1034303 RepID=A0A5N6WZ23_9EURO|nr:hypothetical protein BDV39DRAFT_206089 [Aspergillus sergii]